MPSRFLQSRNVRHDEIFRFTGITVITNLFLCTFSGFESPILIKLEYPHPMLKHAFLKAKKAIYKNGALKSTKCTKEQIGDNDDTSKNISSSLMFRLWRNLEVI